MESLKNPKALQGIFSGYRPTLSIEHNIVRDIELMELVLRMLKRKHGKYSFAIAIYTTIGLRV